MANASQLIQYFRDCYEADNRETGIANLFHKKYRHVTFLAGSDDLLSGVLDRVPIERERALAAQKDAELSRKDKTLVYTAFPLVGLLGAHAHLPSRLCAPVLFYPAMIEDDGSNAFLSVDLTQQRVNFPVLTSLAGIRGGATGSAVEELLAQIPSAPLSKDDLHALMALLMDLLPQVDALQLASYPSLVGEREVRRWTRASDTQTGEGLRCLPACALALIPNSPETRGVLFELGRLADEKSLSTPVRMILQSSPAPAEVRGGKTGGSVPAVLSRAQQGVLASAASKPLTLVVGPPGTGKSYTIAALALDHVSRGESVLIASRMEHAVDVVGRKIKEMLGPSPCVVRGGPQRYLRTLKKSLHQILHGVRFASPVEPCEIRQGKKSLNAICRRVQHLESRILWQLGCEEQWGEENGASMPDGLFATLRRRWKLGYLDWRLSSSRPLWEFVSHYQHALHQRTEASAGFLRTLLDQRIQRLLRHRRQELSRFLRALKTRSDWKQAELFAQIDLNVLLQAFPVWLVTMADVSEILPLVREQFDLVILDEATQCDAASCLPVFQRARRAVVVGDPNQLRHISFLSRQRQAVIAQRNDLDGEQEALFPYREKSILDLVSDTIASQEQVLFLDEHFRSLPPIIDFSNREFYAGSLKVMTERPGTSSLPCVQLRSVTGEKQGGVNRLEADALVQALVDRVEAEAHLPAHLCHSLGVLSPFREQVDHIASLLQKRLSLASLEKHDVLVGTAHTFQGEQRDVMYLSLAVDRDTHPATFVFLNNPNVFNVSITRARSEQYVFCSVRPAELKAGTLVRRYLEATAGGPKRPGSRTTHPRDTYLEEVRAELQRLGFQVWPEYPVAGQRIDLVVERSGQTVGIDLIGCPGELGDAVTLERYRMFERAGLSLFPLSSRAWSKDKAACLQAIVDWCSQITGR